MNKFSLKWALTIAVVLGHGAAVAGDYRFDLFGENVEAIVNNSMIAGAQFRLDKQADSLVGKSDLNRNVCDGVYQLCQGVVRGQAYPSIRLRDAPGQASMNYDEGNVNYNRGDITQAPIIFNTDAKLRWRDYELFVRSRALYDPVNYNFIETRPNEVTPNNFESVLTRGDPFANRYFPATLSHGALVNEPRPKGIADKYYRFFHFLDINLTKPFNVGDQQVLVRVGRQVVNWGESTVTVLNSLSQANPVNANNAFRLGSGLLEDLYIPIDMVSFSTAFTEKLNVSGFYQLEWQPVDLPPPGSFMSFIDLGTNNIGRNVLNAGFGQTPDDFNKLGTRLANPLGLVARTTLTIGRKPDDTPDSRGQFGIKMDYYAENINNGTQFGLYFMNYHSRLPYVSVYSSNASCMRAAGNPQHIDATNTFQLLSVCPNLAVTQYTPGVVQAVADAVDVIAQRPALLGQVGISNPADIPSALVNLLAYQPDKPNSEIIPFDSANIQLTYPRNIHLLGLSFNTTYGDYSFQGEVAYRPNLPLQVSVVDLGFAAQGPTLASCNKTTVHCAGTAAALGYVQNSTGVPGGGGQNTSGQYVVYDKGDHVDANGNVPFNDTVFLLLAGVPNSARAFPNFIIPWRGGTLGNNPPNSLIPGYINAQTFQYTLGATRLYGASENWLGADQLLLVYEIAAEQVLGFPKFDQLQIEGPLTAYTHASAGADGSGANGSRLACSTNEACSIGPDGIRFNPFQASKHSFATAVSGGYRVVGRLLYESVLPSISVSPLFLWQHDIYGNSPAPNLNFVQGRYSLTSIVEIRYEKALSFNVVYNLFGGAGKNNLLADRDNLGFFIKYQF